LTRFSLSVILATRNCRKDNIGQIHISRIHPGETIVNAKHQSAAQHAQRQPHFRKDRVGISMAKAFGFNYVELTVGIAILAGLAGLAAPVFSTVSNNKALRTEAHGILTGLELARTEAIYRNSTVSFTLNTSAGWTVATVTPESPVRTHEPTDGGRRLRVSTLNDQTSVVFTGLGIVSRYSVSSSLTRIMVAPPPGTDGETLQIDVFPNGQARMCNPAITAANDPRKC
jgi:type IV fimbrial biogenesis protein FimT